MLKVRERQSRSSRCGRNVPEGGPPAVPVDTAKLYFGTPSTVTDMRCADLSTRTTISACAAPAKTTEVRKAGRIPNIRNDIGIPSCQKALQTACNWR